MITYNYKTKEGEMVDDIIYRHYGTHAHLQLVLNANPGLAKRGPSLPQELVIILPPAPVEEKKYISLWD